MDIIKINDRIKYIPSSNNPLSADIGIIKDKDYWLYDVGANPISIASLDKAYNVIISHFHNDHLANIDKININKLYVSKETYRHLPKLDINLDNIIIVNENLEIDGLKIIKLPSSHAKGSLGLLVDDYLFIGDALYSSYKNNKLIYNAQLLKELIDILTKADAKYLLVSHHEGLVVDKMKAITYLKEIYDKRDAKGFEIIIN